jgi:hypothetical protein
LYTSDLAQAICSHASASGSSYSHRVVGRECYQQRHRPAPPPPPSPPARPRSLQRPRGISRAADRRHSSRLLPGARASRTSARHTAPLPLPTAGGRRRDWGDRSTGLRWPKQTTAANLSVPNNCFRCCAVFHRAHITGCQQRRPRAAGASSQRGACPANGTNLLRVHYYPASPLAANTAAAAVRAVQVQWQTSPAPAAATHAPAPAQAARLPWALGTQPAF